MATPTSSGVIPVRAYQIVGLNGLELVDEAKLAHLLNYNQAFRARNGRTAEEYFVRRELLDCGGQASLEHARNIYGFGRDWALRLMEMRSTAASGAQDPGKRLFHKAELPVIEVSSPRNLVHLSFMLREVAERGGDYLLATAVLLHNTEQHKSLDILKKGEKLKGPLKAGIEAVLETCALFQRLRSYHYDSHANHVHDTVDSVVKLARGNWRSLLIFFVHQLSSLSTQTHKVEERQNKVIKEIYCSLCERFGLKQLSKKLKDRALRLYDPELYETTETYIQDKKLKMGRLDAEIELSALEQKLADYFRESRLGLISTFSRVKTAASALDKITSKPEEYPDLESIHDYLAATVVTRETAGRETTDMVVAALAGEFTNIDGKQTLPGFHLIGGRQYTVWHTHFKLNNGTDLEIQVMDQETFRAIETGERAHWIYDLKKTAKCRFDEKLLDEIAPELTMDFARDARTVYDHIKKWDYVYVETPKGRQTIRCNHGSLPIDVYYIMNGQLTNYSGTVACEPVSGQPFLSAADDKPLGDGAVIKFAANGKVALSPFLNPAHEETRQALRAKAALPPRVAPSSSPFNKRPNKG